MLYPDRYVKEILLATTCITLLAMVKASYEITTTCNTVMDDNEYLKAVLKDMKTSNSLLEAYVVYSDFLKYPSVHTSIHSLPNKGFTEEIPLLLCDLNNYPKNRKPPKFLTNTVPNYSDIDVICKDNLLTVQMNFRNEGRVVLTHPNCVSSAAYSHDQFLNTIIIFMEYSEDV